MSAEAIVRSLPAALLSLLLCAPAGADEYDLDRLEEIPAEYRGRWNSDAAACRPFAGRRRLEIGAREISVGGDRFRADYIWMEEDGITVISDYVGPAASWTRIDRFRLADGERRLVDEHARRTIVRIRC